MFIGDDLEIEVTDTKTGPGAARKLLACLAILLIFVAGSQGITANAASALPPPDTPTTSTGLKPVYTDGGECVPPDKIEAVGGTKGTNEERLEYLPLNRWGGHTSNLHSRLGSKITDDVRQRVSRDMMQTTMMSFGDALWGITGGLVTFATEYSVLDKAGCTADAASAALGGALMDGIAPIFVGAGIILALWRARQGAEKPGKKLTAMIITLSIFAILLNGARNTAETNTISPGSPAYIAVTLDGVVTAVAAAPTAAMNANMPTAAAFGTSGKANEADTTDCANLIAHLREQYAAGQPQFLTAKAMIPVSVSSMWEQSGLMSYAKVQYGSKNSYAQATYCRQLERSAGITPAQQQQMLAATGGPDGGVIELFGGGNNKTSDQAGVFWAACQYSAGGWSVRGDWGAVTGSDGNGDDKPSAEDCGAVWGDWGKASKPEHGFEWSDSPDNIEKRTAAAPDARDFMLNWHGDAVTNGLAVAFVYVASSAVVLLVFGLISVGIIIAKSVGVVMIVMVFLMLAMALIPSQGENNKLVKFFKFWLGMTFYSAGLMFILALVALITAFVNQVGLESFGEGSLMSILWMGFAPVTAIILLHVVFKHAVGIPSPFKPGAALAFGGTLAGAGAALGIGVDRMARRGRGMASGYGRGMSQRAGYNRGGEKRGKGRDQKMPVGGAVGAGAGAGAAGAGMLGSHGAPAEGGMGGMDPGSDGAGQAKPTLRERMQANKDLGWGERARQAGQVPRDAVARKLEEFKSKGMSRFRVPAVAGAAALAWAGIGGAATVLAAPAAPLVGAAIGARALYRARSNHKARVANGESASVGSASASRSNARVAEYRARQTARQDAATQTAAAANHERVAPMHRAAAAANYRREKAEAEAARAAGFDAPMPEDPDRPSRAGSGSSGPRARPVDGGSTGDGTGPSRSGGRPSGPVEPSPNWDPVPNWDPAPNPRSARTPDAAPSGGSHSRRPHSRPVRPPR